MRKVRVQDVVPQSVVSILNLSARRIAKEDERDLEQARVGIEAVRAMVDLLDPRRRRDRKALSELQMLYAKHAGGGPRRGRAGGRGAEPGGAAASGARSGRKGDSRLWTRRHRRPTVAGHARAPSRPYDWPRRFLRKLRRRPFLD